MNISTHFKKAPWMRMVHPDKVSGRFASNYKPLPGSTLDVAFVQLTASDFLKELNPAAHPINSRYMSTRPIYKPSGKKDANGKDEWVLDGYDELESVALGWQKFIVGNKIAHLTGAGGFATANESRDDETYSDFLSWMDYAGIKDAFTEAVMYAEHAGDSGILLYQTDDDEVEYEVYGAEKGHTIYPQKDETGKPIYYIQYWKDGKEMCDIISTKSRESWVHADATDESNLLFFEKLVREVGISKGIVSEDGWTLVSKKDSQVGSDLCQFIYFRVPDTCWGPAQLSIEAHENAASYVANEVKSSAFPLLVVKSEKVTAMPPSDLNGKIVGIRGTADSLAHSDVRFESPADASNIATVHFNELNRDIVRTTLTAIIDPEILKQGADSSTTIKILFRPEIEWAMQRWVYYVKPVRQLVKVFKRLVGKIVGKLDQYDSMRVSVAQEYWIPQNDQEHTKIVLDKVYARVLSRKNAQNELGSQYRDDYEIIQREWEEEIQMKAEIPAKVEAEYGTAGSVADDDNPNLPAVSVTNQAKGKTILGD